MAGQGECVMFHATVVAGEKEEEEEEEEEDMDGRDTELVVRANRSVA